MPKRKNKACAYILQSTYNIAVYVYIRKHVVKVTIISYPSVTPSFFTSAVVETFLWYIRNFLSFAGLWKSNVTRRTERWFRLRLVASAKSATLSLALISIFEQKLLECELTSILYIRNFCGSLSEVMRCFT